MNNIDPPFRKTNNLLWIVLILIVVSIVLGYFLYKSETKQNTEPIKARIKQTEAKLDTNRVNLDSFIARVKTAPKNAANANRVDREETKKVIYKPTPATDSVRDYRADVLRGKIK